MTFKVLIIEDNHSFIDSLKVMLRDLPLDFTQAYRYNDALAILEKSGIFYNRHEQAAATTDSGSAADAPAGKKSRQAAPAPLFNDGGVFLLIIEQNTETNMKGTDFVTHAIRKFPGLSEGDFILLTHRLDAVPTRNYGFPVIEKPLRAPQIRQIVLQKIKQAQDITEQQARAEAAPEITGETEQVQAKGPRKGLRDLLKMTRAQETEAEPAAAEKKPAKRTTKAKAAKKSPAAAKKAKPK